MNYIFFDKSCISAVTNTINPVSNIGIEFKKKFLKNKSYHIFNSDKISLFKKEKLEIKSENMYKNFIDSLFNCINISNNKVSYDTRINEVLNLLDKGDSSIYSIKKLAEKVYLSQSRLSHLFKSEVGIPLKSYITLYQIQKAYLHYFKGENITVSAINAGFDTPSHFAYTSKRITGMSATNINKDSVFLKVDYL